MPSAFLRVVQAEVLLGLSLNDVVLLGSVLPKHLWLQYNFHKRTGRIFLLLPDGAPTRRVRQGQQSQRAHFIPRHGRSQGEDTRLSCATEVKAATVL